jgi:uncharacterized membrane protein YoaK (UPF0700 family)
VKAGYLECERRWTFWLLIFVAGWYSAYTFFLRGGVFCNAQTANVVLFAMALGRQQWLSAAYLLLPIGAYFFGSFLSEWMGKTIKRMHFLRWDTLLIALEMCAVVFLALMPAAWPDQICQVTLNFVCAMQFNTYRQMEGVPAATTFVTNHIRQIGSNLAKLIRHPEDHGLRRKIKAHTSVASCSAFTAWQVRRLHDALRSILVCVRFWALSSPWDAPSSVLSMPTSCSSADSSISCRTDTRGASVFGQQPCCPCFPASIGPFLDTGWMQRGDWSCAAGCFGYGSHHCRCGCVCHLFCLSLRTQPR